MTTIVDNEEELNEEEGGPLLDSLSDLSDSITQIIHERIAANPLVQENERKMAFSSICQMLSLNAMVDLAEEIECDPLDIVDTWANAFYEALDLDADDEEETA
jgi:hypothetical protein